MSSLDEVVLHSLDFSNLLEVSGQNPDEALSEHKGEDSNDQTSHHQLAVVYLLVVRVDLSVVVHSVGPVSAFAPDSSDFVSEQNRVPYRKFSLSLFIRSLFSLSN